MTVSPQQRIATGTGGWYVEFDFVDGAGNPVDYLAGSLSPFATFYQGNLGLTTPLVLDTTGHAAGRLIALVPNAVVLSTLTAPSSARLLGAAQPTAPAYPFRVHAWLVDSRGAQISDQVVAIQPVDPRTTDVSLLPVPQPVVSTVGPAGSKGDPGAQGPKGDPGGFVPHVAPAVQDVAQFQVVRFVAGGVAPASSATSAQAGSVAGIATVAASGGQTTTYLDGGTITNAAWTWSIGPIFFDNFGALTQTPPTGGFRQQVAAATSPTSITVALGPARVID